MASLVLLRRRRIPRRKRALTFNQILSGIGTSVATATAKGRFGMIGKAAGVATATADAAILVGSAHGTATAHGVINAGNSVGTIDTVNIGPHHYAEVNGIINATNVAATIATVTTVFGQSGYQGTAFGKSGSIAVGTVYVDEEADINAFGDRIRSLIPPSWFADTSGPILSIPVMGMAYGLLWIYELYLYTLAQARIKTASGVWLDRISYDFLGTHLPRLTSESDDDYRTRIVAGILAPKQTRAAITQSLDTLTGNKPTIIELFNPGDTGTYGTTGSNGIGTQGYGVAGMYGSLSFPNQFLVTAFRPRGEGIPNVPSYGSPYWGYGAADGGEYADLNDIVGQVTDADIYANVAATIGAGNTAWTTIQTPPDVIDAPTAYFGNVNNSSLAAILAAGFFF